MTHAIRNVLLATATAALLATPAARADLPRQPVLPLATAMQMIAACINFAGEKKISVSVVVRDSGSHVLASARMDGAPLLTYDAALRKSDAAVGFPIPTRNFADYAFDAKTGLPNGVAFLPGVVLVPGGLPIKTATGLPIGAIGVSGGSGEEDEACGQAGIDAVKAELK